MTFVLQPFLTFPFLNIFFSLVPPLRTFFYDYILLSLDVCPAVIFLLSPEVIISFLSFFCLCFMPFRVICFGLSFSSNTDVFFLSPFPFRYILPLFFLPLRHVVLCFILFYFLSPSLSNRFFRLHSFPRALFYSFIAFTLLFPLSLFHLTHSPSPLLRSFCQRFKYKNRKAFPTSPC